MIDLTKAPKGTTGYFIGATFISFYNGNKYWHDHYNMWIDSVNGEEWLAENVVALQDEWSVYNNDKPLHELTDEQRGLLFIMLCKGSPMQYKFNGEWEDRPKGNSLINTNAIYRVKKQKTERELFIESFDGVNLTGTRSEIIETLFNLGFKTPESDE